MKILIPGGAGYFGSYLTNFLLERGHSVVVLDKLNYGAYGLFSNLTNPAFKLIHGDVSNLGHVGLAFKEKPDYVVHLASLVGERLCKKYPLEASTTNINGTKTLVYYIQQHKLPMGILFASTCSNYGKMRRSHEANEYDKLNPLSLYSETKIKAENVVIEAGGVVFRLGTLYGFSPRFRADLMVHEFIRDAITHGSIKLHNPKAWRPFTHLRDACWAIYNILITGLENYSKETFNIVGENITKVTLANLVAKSFDCDVLVDKGKSGDARDYRVSSTKAVEILSFRSEQSIGKFIHEFEPIVRSGAVDLENPMFDNVKGFRLRL